MIIRTLALARHLILIFLTLEIFSHCAVAKYEPEQSIPNNHDRVALIIGNGDYKHIGKLKNSQNDAEKIKNALVLLGFNDVSFHKDLATKNDMSAAISDFFRKNAAKSWIRLIYYSGHGLEKNHNNYLIPTNAKLGNSREIHNNSYDLSELINELDSSGTGVNIIILDTCRVAYCDGNCRNVLDSGINIEKELIPKGTLIAYSTKSGQPASDNGLFTDILVKHLINPQGKSLSQVFQEVKNEFNHGKDSDEQKAVTEDDLENGDNLCLTNSSGICGMTSSEVKAAATQAKRPHSKEKIISKPTHQRRISKKATSTPKHRVL